MKSRCTFPAK